MSIYLAILNNGLTAFRLEIFEYCYKEEIIKRERELFYLDTDI
jgi:hypothetical protein